jgi:Ca2+-binding RTX toxin-like protein
MGTIRVEAVPVKSYGLGLFRIDHLQLVYEDETSPIHSQDYWYVIEGIQDGSLFSGTLGASGESGRLSLSVANGASRDGLVALIGTPESRGSRILSTGTNALSLWDAMAKYAGDIEFQKFPYIPYSLPFSASPTINSTSLIASVLHSVGIDLNNLMPFNMRFSPGPETILGTSQGDTLQADATFTTIAGGQGEDTLLGSANPLWLEKMYGGSGDDTFMWSLGDNIIHGGQTRMAYNGDGLDTVDYSGVGAVHIIANTHPVDHKVSEFISFFDGGTDQLFSIERITWDAKNDTVTTGEGVGLIEKPIGVDLQGNAGGHGDEFAMTDSVTPLLVNVISSTLISVQTQDNAGLDAGYWVNSAEWFDGSKADDKIYVGGGLLGADGGDGNDILDARLVDPFSAQSPLGYDIELYGGKGNDTIVSGAGRTYAVGGEGSDHFVLSSMTSGAGTVELDIDGADASDKLYVPYDMFKVARGGFDGSELFQVSGGVFKIDALNTPTYFFWGDPSLDQVHGNIEFVGEISYDLTGSDLIIHILLGHQEVKTIDNGPGEPPTIATLAVAEIDTESIVRVHNWSDGILGITFPVTWDPDVASQLNFLADYPGWHDAVNAATAADKFIAPLDARPDAHLPKEIVQPVAAALAAAPVFARAAAALLPPVTDGTSGNDTIVATVGGPYHISGLGGDDDITGSDGGDAIDGGTGADIMRGGLGNDDYYVDNAGDQVIETARGGFDRVYSSIDYQLGQYVEHLTLEGTAVFGTGNDLRNTLIGNASNNTLTSFAGDDTLAGNGGDDTLIGGDGGDGYVYEFGDGHDTIIETGTGAGSQDVIILAGGLKAADVGFVRDPASNLDLTLAFADGGTLTVHDYFAATGPNIEGLQFTSGGQWSAAELAALAAAASATSNAAPIAVDDMFTYSGGNTLTMATAALLDNDRDANGDQLSVTGLSHVTGGQAVLDGQGNIVITRAASGNGNVSFDYNVSDGHGGTSHAFVDVAMNSPAVVNAAPVISAAVFSAVVEDHAATGYLTATDADQDPLTYGVKLGAGPSKGVVTVNADGSFVFTPTANANGTDSFTLTVSDGHNAPVESKFEFVIAAVNDGPVAMADSGFSVQHEGKLKIAAAALLANDTDADGDTLSVVSVSAAKGGTVSRAADGTITFKAKDDYAGPASFKYTVSDGHGGTSTAIVSLTVLPEKHAPHEINGTSGHDVLTSTHGDDIMCGKASSDTFVFSIGNGHDQITDFQTGGGLGQTKDIVDLRTAGFTGYSDLIQHLHETAAGTQITMHDGGSILLKGIHENALLADNFRIF